jgi:hypothetical protein
MHKALGLIPSREKATKKEFLVKLKNVPTEGLWEKES